MQQQVIGTTWAPYHRIFITRKNYGFSNEDVKLVISRQPHLWKESYVQFLSRSLTLAGKYWVVRV